MSDVETRARDALNEVAKERRQGQWHSTWPRSTDTALETVCRLIEQQDAFGREVSDIVSELLSWPSFDTSFVRHRLSRLILPDPVDPLLIEARKLCAKVVEDLADANGLKATEEHWRHKYLTGECDRNKDVQAIFAALKRGLTIVATVDGEGAK